MNRFVIINGGTLVDPERVDAITWSDFTERTTLHVNGSRIDVAMQPQEVLDIIGKTAVNPKIEQAVKKATTNVRKAK